MDNNGNVPRFDPMTGKPIETVDNAANNAPKFDPMTGEPLNAVDNTANETVNNTQNSFENTQSVATNTQAPAQSTFSTQQGAGNQSNFGGQPNFGNQPNFSNQPNFGGQSGQNGQGFFGGQGGQGGQPGFGGNQGFNQSQTYNAAGEPVDTSNQVMNEYSSFMRNNANGAGGSFKTPSSRGGFKKFVLAAIAVLVIAAGIITFAFKGKVVNAFKLHTLSPSKYYEWVMKKSYKKVKKDRMDLYKYTYDILTADEKGVEGSVNVKAGKDLVKLVEDLGQDTKGLESVGAEFSAGTTKDTVSITASGKLNDKTFASVEAGATKDLKSVYAGVPEISDKYVDFSNLIEKNASRKQIDQYLEKASKLDFKKLIPTPEFVEDESDRYFDVYLDYVVKNKMISKSSETVEASGVKAKMTALDCDFDGEDVCDLAVEFLEEVKDDDKIDDYVKDLIKNIEDATGENFGISKYDEEKKDGIDKIIKDIKDSKDNMKDYKNILKMTVYVDAEGDVAGYNIKVSDGKKEKEILESKSVLVVSGKKFGYDMSVKSNGGLSYSIEGTGNANFSKTSGEFDITVNSGKDKFNATAELKNCDTTKLLKGYFKGDIIIKTDDISKVKDLEVKLSIDEKRLDTTVGVVVSVDGKEYGNVDFSLKFTDDPKEVKPGDTIDANDTAALEKEFSSFDYKKYVDDFLKDAGIDASADELESVLKLFGKNNLNLPDKFSNGGVGQTEPETNYTEPETSTDTFDFGSGEQETSTEYSQGTVDAGTGDGGSDIPQYDDKYWETYEFPSIDEKYWETYTFNSEQ
ncbi:hypothetical protein SAMN02745111_00632 [Eubacterium uniforme]|uniref:Uncharacterized protein n=1 Tax=Eubacterium uniforme TaxID=39495 RepID=A0A1T4VC49_9FIRM|nr:hypothetical protein [Eubacterium uniforme]SKA62510.1 hypothetical protein SAMN02745111_00632 [Eubacterium uniforme]